MNDYIKILEAQNEELQEKLTEAQNQVLAVDENNRWLKDFILVSFVNAMTASRRASGINAPDYASHCDYILNIFKTRSNEEIYDEYWGKTPYDANFSLKKYDAIDEYIKSIESLKGLILRVLEEYRSKNIKS